MGYAKNESIRIFAADNQRGETAEGIKKDAETYAMKLRNLGFTVRVVKRNFANPNYDVVYIKGLRSKSGKKKMLTA